MTALVALFAFVASANAMSYEQARQQALFLTDKMAYELNLTEEQYEAAYEVNLDYLMGVNTQADLYGPYWERRNMDLSYILLDWQYRLYLDATYFYRPLYWSAGYWHFGIYARYPYRDYFYFGRPHFYSVYRGGHAWHMNGGRSWYRGRTFAPAGRSRDNHFGMHNRFERGDYGRGNRNMGSQNHGNNSFGNRGNHNGNNGYNGNGRDRGYQNGNSGYNGTGRDRGNQNGNGGYNGTGRDRGQNHGLGNRSVSSSRVQAPNTTTQMDRGMQTAPTKVDAGRTTPSNMNQNGNFSGGQRPSSTRTTVGGRSVSPRSTTTTPRQMNSTSSPRSTFSPSRSVSPSRSSSSMSSPSRSISAPSRSSSSMSAPSRSSMGSSRGSMGGGSRSSMGGGSRGGGSHSGGGHFGGRR